MTARIGFTLLLVGLASIALPIAIQMQFVVISLLAAWIGFSYLAVSGALVVVGLLLIVLDRQSTATPGLSSNWTKGLSAEDCVARLREHGYSVEPQTGPPWHVSGANGVATVANDLNELRLLLHRLTLREATPT